MLSWCRLSSSFQSDSNCSLFINGRVWASLQSSEVPPPQEDMAKWESEFQQLMQSQRDDADYGKTMREGWENGLGSYDGEEMKPSDSFDTKFDEEGIPILGPYIFGKLEECVIFRDLRLTDS